MLNPGDLVTTIGVDPRSAESDLGRVIGPSGLAGMVAVYWARARETYNECETDLALAGDIYIADVRTGDIVRKATREEIASAREYPGALITYEFGGTYSFGRHGYLARATVDDQGNEIAIGLDDDEIAAVCRARGIK